MNPDQAKAAVVVEWNDEKLLNVIASLAWSSNPRGYSHTAEAVEYLKQRLAATSPESSRLGEGLTEAEREALRRWENNANYAGVAHVDQDIRLICAALRRLSASPGVIKNKEITEALAPLIAAARLAGDDAVCTEAQIIAALTTFGILQRPAECVNGCPPKQVCNFCQGVTTQHGKDKDIP